MPGENDPVRDSGQELVDAGSELDEEIEEDPRFYCPEGCFDEPEETRLDGRDGYHVELVHRETDKTFELWREYRRAGKALHSLPIYRLDDSIQGKRWRAEGAAARLFHMAEAFARYLNAGGGLAELEVLVQQFFEDDPSIGMPPNLKLLRCEYEITSVEYVYANVLTGEGFSWVEDGLIEELSVDEMGLKEDVTDAEIEPE